MKTLEQIRGNETNGAKYWAIAENGHKYKATYSDNYFGGIMFFCIPEGVKIIGYKKRDVKTFTIKIQGNYTGGDLIRKCAKENGFTVEYSDWFQTFLIINGKKYEYDEINDDDGKTVKFTVAEIA